MRRLACIALGAAVVLPAPVAGQAPVPLPTIMPHRAGECRVRIEIPARPDGSALEVQLNKGGIARLPLDPRPQVVLLPLGAALEEGDEIRARLGSGAWSETYSASSDRSGDPACAAPSPSPPSPQAAEIREVFEASGFLGQAFDQFAPKIVGNYIDRDPGSDLAQSRLTAGLSLDYRVLGSERRTVQFWVAAHMLYGLRTADIDCEKEKGSPFCSSKTATTQDKFLFILENASTLEAHFAPRLEFFTFQPRSETPLKAYVGAQFGFVHLQGAPKVSEIDNVGLGVVIPSGPFRKSFIEWSSGRNSLFQSNPKWNRFKVTGVLAFDLVPGLKERSAWWKYTGFGSWRAFVATSIDRNLFGPGPDAIQSYVGFAFDFRRAFRP